VGLSSFVDESEEPERDDESSSEQLAGTSSKAIDRPIRGGTVAGMTYRDHLRDDKRFRALNRTPENRPVLPVRNRPILPHRIPDGWFDEACPLVARVMRGCLFVLRPPLWFLDRKGLGMPSRCAGSTWEELGLELLDR